MTSINLLRVSTPGCHSQGMFQIKGIQAQHTNLGVHNPHGNGWIIKILKHIKLISIKLQCCDIQTMWQPFQVQVHSYSYSVWNMYTNICLDLCDPKRSHCVNMLAFLILYNWVSTNTIYRKWIYVIQCRVFEKKHEHQRRS